MEGGGGLEKGAHAGLTGPYSAYFRGETEQIQRCGYLPERQRL